LAAQAAEPVVTKPAAKQPEVDPFVQTFVENIIRNDYAVGTDANKSYIIPFGMGPCDMSKMDAIEAEVSKYNRQMARRNGYRY
jgi:hypothetical protein